MTVRDRWSVDVRGLLVILPATLLGAAAGDAAETRSFALGADAAVVDGHRYAVLEVALPPAERFSVALRSTELDSYLTVISPLGAFHDDDRSGGNDDALVVIDDPVPGRWLVIATTAAPGEAGRVELRIDPGHVIDDTGAALSPSLAARVVAGRQARDEAPAKPAAVTSEASAVATLAAWLGESEQRRATAAIIGDKRAKLEAERRRLEAELLRQNEPPAATGEATTGPEPLRDAVAEIEASMVDLDAVDGLLDEIDSLQQVVDGGGGVQQVIQELVAEAQAKREGFASIAALLEARRTALASRLIAGDVVVIGPTGPLASR
jgi:hypothetical protein